jgi:hypothetical protein
MIIKKKEELQEITLIGLALPSKTTNENGQSNIDCGNLWQKFEQGDYVSKIPGKKCDDIFAVYHDYEGDHTQPFSYFIGCEVNDDTDTPDGMNRLTIPKGRYCLLYIFDVADDPSRAVIGGPCTIKKNNSYTPLPRQAECIKTDFGNAITGGSRSRRGFGLHFWRSPVWSWLLLSLPRSPYTKATVLSWKTRT